MPSHHTPVDNPTTNATPTGDERGSGNLSSSTELHAKSATLAMTNSDNSWKHDSDDRDQSPVDDLGHDTDHPLSAATTRPESFDGPQDTNTPSTASPANESPPPAESAPASNRMEVLFSEKEKPSGEPADVPAKESDGFDKDKPLTMTTYMVVPPDGGWGWVVTAASFLCNIVVDGFVYTFGTFLGPIADDLEVSRAKVTIVGSLLSGFYLMSGPFVSALANRYGFRPVAIVGSFFAAAAFAISALATNINFLIISYGIFGGIGFGFIYVPSVITVGFYFERWRAIATGIAVCGSGIGTFILAPLFSTLIESVGWRYTFLVQAAIVLSCAIFGALYRPLKPIKVTVPYDPTKADEVEAKQTTEVGDEANGVGPEDLPLLLRIKQARDEQRTLSMTSLECNAYLTAAQIQHSSTRVLKSSCLSLNVAVSPAQSPTPNFKRAANGTAVNGDPEKTISAPLKAILSVAQNVPSPPASPDMRQLPSDNHYLTICAPFTFRRASADDRRRLRPRSESSGRIHLVGNGLRSRAATTGHHGAARHDGVVSPAGARPMYRDDIFFGASLQRLQQYSSQTSALNYTMSVTRLPTRADVDEEKEKQCKLCPEAVKRTLATMLDVSMLRSPSFILLAASGFMTSMGFYVPFMYMTDRAKQGGIDPSTSVLLISAIGIANTIGRVVCGLVTSMPSVNALLINNVALTLGGLGTILSGLWITPGYQFFYACVFGIALACFASLRTILIVDLMGLEKLTNAFGLLLLFQGIAAAIGAPLAGSLLGDKFDYNPAFYLSGALILISAIMCYPLNWVNNWEKRRKEEDVKETIGAKVV